MNEYDPREQAELFEKDRKKYQCFELVLRAYIEKEIAQKLNAESFSKTPIIESRTKEVESFRKKISREDKRGKYKNPIEDVTDLVGLKVMPISLPDEEIVYNLLNQKFQSYKIQEHCIDKTHEKKENRQFGYLGRHLVIECKEDLIKELKPIYNDQGVQKQIQEYLRGGGSKYSLEDFIGLKAEIQIKTLLQHVWAEIEHGARYKPGEELSDEKSRTFDRLAALVEIADDMFKALIQESREKERKLHENITTKHNAPKERVQNKEGLSEVLNSENIHSYLTHKTIQQHFSNIKSQYFQIDNEKPDFIGLSFVELLKIVGLKCIGDLDELLFDDKLLQEMINCIENDHQSKRKNHTIYPQILILRILICLKYPNQIDKIKDKRFVDPRLLENIKNYTIQKELT
ncbi:GTP pyrophosphokinase [Helicobacter brantae]|nr:hypothetical protein [Helicobacter brantae]